MFAVLRTEREWPWSDDGFGWTGLLAVAGVLVLLTLWTYSGTRRVGWRRLVTVLLLRLAALAIAFLLVIRPYFAQEQAVLNDGQVVLVLDYSSSMRITDGPNNQSRWETLGQLLEWPEIKEAFARLTQEKNIKIYRYMGAEDVRPYDAKNSADGKRTDIGYWLFHLHDKHKNDRNLRGLLVFSDGANNGTKWNAIKEANEWRGLRCPIHCLGVGSPNTKKGQSDIAVTDVIAPQQVFIGGTIRVKATVDAPNLEGQVVMVRLLVDGVEESKNKVMLLKTRGNKIDVGEFKANKAGEVKVTVKIDEVIGEYTTLNNEMSTFVTVLPEGIKVLWIEGRKRLEATWIIRHALSKDTRFSVLFDERLDDAPLTRAQEAAMDFKSTAKKYDIIVIGDITARRFSGNNAAMFADIKKLVQIGGTGLLMLGGFLTFGNGDWPALANDLAELLPVDLKARGQIEDKVNVKVVDKGHPLLQVGLTDFFAPLDGAAKLGPTIKGVVPLLVADNDNNDTILAATAAGKGRVVVFAGDTTHETWWDIANPKSMEAYERFWRQMFVWLAKQEDGNKQLLLKLDKRRLAAASKENLGFSVKLLDEKGREVKGATYTFKVTGPDKEAKAALTGFKGGEERGAIGPVNVAGEYKITVTAKGGGSDKTEVVEARFEGFAEDVENQRPAANHKFLEDVAAAGGGTFRVAGKEELLQLLNDLRDKTAAPGWVQTEVWPNWKASPASESPFDQMAALWVSGALACFVLFTLLICTEWFLRRWWGLV